jgi:hypothetical protein
MLLQDPSHNIPGHFVIGLLQINENHMQVFILYHVSLHKLSYQENRLHGRSTWYKTKLVFSDVDYSP